MKDAPSLSQEIQIVLAGAIGGFLAVAFEKATFWKSVISVITGAACAYYLTPVISHYVQKWFHDSGGLEGAIGFVIGMCSMKISKGILAIGDVFVKNPLGTIKSILTFNLKEFITSNSAPKNDPNNNPDNGTV